MENTKRKLIVVVLIMAFFAFNIYSFSVNNVKAETEADKTQSKIDKTQKEIDKITAELATLNSQKYKNQTQISATQALLSKLKSDISKQEAELDSLKQMAEFNKKMLAEYIRQMYYIDQEEPIIRLSLSQGSLSDLAENSDGLISIKEKIIDALAVIDDAKTQAEKAKAELAEQEKAKQRALQSQKVQQAQIVDDVQDAQATLGELQKKLAELQSDLLAVTGKSYSAKNIQDAVEFASGRTGVPKGVLYGFLKMETNLGANTGQCTYEQVEKVSVARYKKYGSKYKASIALLYKRKDLFYGIVKNLGYSKDKKVSCSPSYIGQGGAMGVSQFMSDTWNGYSAQISAQTGHSKPNPWDLTDGVMALALKLKRAGATSNSTSAIKNASINYLGAFNSRYYNGIVYWSKNYKTLFP